MNPSKGASNQKSHPDTHQGGFFTSTGTPSGKADCGSAYLAGAAGMAGAAGAAGVAGAAAVAAASL